jgi:hypothetical protein
VALALLAAGTVGPARAAAPSVVCETVALSPNFAKDKTMFCAYSALAANRLSDPVLLYRSTNAGRTWSSPVTVSSEPGDFVGNLYVSPTYPVDHTLFVETYSGGYVSTDSGKTFSRIGNGLQFSPFFATVFTDEAPAGPVRPQLITVDAVFDPLLTPYRGLSRPLLNPATGAMAMHYLVPPDFASAGNAVLIAEGGMDADDDAQLRALACNRQFVCTDPIYTFPMPSNGKDPYLDYTGAIYPGAKDNYVVTKTDDDFPVWQVLRTPDNGQTWQSWTSVEKLLRGAHYYTEAFVFGSPDAPNRLFLRISTLDEGARDGVPQEQLFRSDDKGATWHRIGFAWGSTQKARSRSTLPWNSLRLAYQAPIVAPGGRLYLIGGQRSGKKDKYLGTFCSPDLGRTWVRGFC